MNTNEAERGSFGNWISQGPVRSGTPYLELPATAPSRVGLDLDRSCLTGIWVLWTGALPQISDPIIPVPCSPFWVKNFEASVCRIIIPAGRASIFCKHICRRTAPQQGLRQYHKSAEWLPSDLYFSARIAGISCLHQKAVRKTYWCVNVAALKIRVSEHTEIIQPSFSLKTVPDSTSSTTITKSKPSDFPSHLRQKLSSVQTVQRHEVNTDARTSQTCGKCGRLEVRYYAVQLRSADEGSTIFYTCDCGHK